MEVEAKGEPRVQLIYLASRISSRMLVSESERDKDKDKKRMLKSGTKKPYINNGNRRKDFRVDNITSGQSYKHFMSVNYDSRVIIWGIF